MDIAARKIIANLKEVDSVHVQVLPVKLDDGNRSFQRRITVVRPTDKTVAALARIDIPASVKIFIR